MGASLCKSMEKRERINSNSPRRGPDKSGEQKIMIIDLVYVVSTVNGTGAKTSSIIMADFVGKLCDHEEATYLTN